MRPISFTLQDLGDKLFPFGKVLGAFEQGNVVEFNGGHDDDMRVQASEQEQAMRTKDE